MYINGNNNDVNDEVDELEASDKKQQAKLGENNDAHSDTSLSTDVKADNVISQQESKEFVDHGNRDEDYDVLQFAATQSAKSNASAKRSASKMKKAPDAPKRFKSAFIFFSTHKHKEIRAQLGQKGLTEKTSNISKLVSEAWKEISPEKRAKWENMARNDRNRYDLEKSMFKGPWHVPKERKQKDASAPKRPMSAFLAFANSRRGAVKRGMPAGASNGDVSRALAAMWKEAPDHVRQRYIDEENEKRQSYKAVMSDWRIKNDEDKRLKRQQRENMALCLAEKMEENSGDDGMHYHDNEDDSHHDDRDPSNRERAAQPTGNNSFSAFYPNYSLNEGQGSAFASSFSLPYDPRQHSEAQLSSNLDRAKVFSSDQQEPLASLLSHSNLYPDHASSALLPGLMFFNQNANPHTHYHSSYQPPSSASSALNPFPGRHPDLNFDPYYTNGYSSGVYSTQGFSSLSSLANQSYTPQLSSHDSPGYQYWSHHPNFGYPTEYSNAANGGASNDYSPGSAKTSPPCHQPSSENGRPPHQR